MARDLALDADARALHAWVAGDARYQRRLRVRQARWRHDRGLPIGEHRGAPLGSRLAMPFAEHTLANYLTDTIRDVVRAEVLAAGNGKLYGRPRIFNDLLSSQPLCFNLFGEAAADLGLASRTFSALLGDAVQVDAITFEHSPGRGDPRFTGDRSAFDVFVTYTSGGRRGFLGIEVKYHEDLRDAPGTHKPRYDEIASAMRAFRAEHRPSLRARPLQQLWRDHLLAASLLLDGGAGFDDGRFVVVYSSENTRCEAAIAAYRAALVDGCGSFAAWTLEDVVAALKGAGAGAWVREVEARYSGSAG